MKTKKDRNRSFFVGIYNKRQLSFDNPGKEEYNKNISCNEYDDRSKVARQRIKGMFESGESYYNIIRYRLGDDLVRKMVPSLYSDNVDKEKATEELSKCIEYYVTSLQYF